MIRLQEIREQSRTPLILSVNAQVLGILVQYAKPLNGGRDGCNRLLCITSPGDTDEVEADNVNFVVQLETRKGCSPNTMGSSCPLECTRRAIFRTPVSAYVVV